MAGNMKGRGGIKGLLLQHGEKAAIGVFGFVALWLVYKTTALPRLGRKIQSCQAPQRDHRNHERRAKRSMARAGK